MGKHIILGIHVTDRVNKAGQVQHVLTEYGCNIKTRVGLHDVNGTECSPQGLILLEICGDESSADEMVGKLGAIEGIDVQKMVFEHS